MNSFSERQGLARPDAEITIRNDAPPELRDATIQIAYQSGLRPSDIRERLCQVLYRSPDKGNWSEFPNIDGEVRDLIGDCEWFEVYDLIEMLAAESERRGQEYADRMNRFFRATGVGWQLVDNRVETRGTEVFEAAVRQGQAELRQQGRHTAATELHEALNDLSRRPQAETTGAIQHAMAALECVARDVTGSKDTLGQLIQRNPGLFPAPVDQIVGKAWGYTSNYGRHLTEGDPPKFEEAEMMVGLSGVLCRYLARKVPENLR
ncbi:AbiJ-NTD4 domain-containing protein [Burkholderia cepacia]|uniref:AbiJ-NTD4 domain-containing protein n=1 Tax=Burkholderia cepacia TaxID=292 RepID=UPI0009BFFCE7|nr:hypothetical protein [Burkholderia cepacia]